MCIVLHGMTLLLSWRCDSIPICLCSTLQPQYTAHPSYCLEQRLRPARQQLGQMKEKKTWARQPARLMSATQTQSAKPPPIVSIFFSSSSQQQQILIPFFHIYFFSFSLASRARHAMRPSESMRHSMCRDFARESTATASTTSAINSFYFILFSNLRSTRLLRCLSKHRIWFLFSSWFVLLPRISRVSFS